METLKFIRRKIFEQSFSLLDVILIIIAGGVASYNLFYSFLIIFCGLLISTALSIKYGR